MRLVIALMKVDSILAFEPMVRPFCVGVILCKGVREVDLVLLGALSLLLLDRSSYVLSLEASLFLRRLLALDG